MSDPAHKETDRLLAEAEKRIAKEYKRANEEVGAKLQAYLQKFEDDDKKMRERLQKGEITAKDYANFRARKIAVGKRWEALRDTLAEDYHNASQIAMSTIRGHLPEVYAINHNFATYQVEHDALVDTNYTLYDRHTVERLMEQDRDLLPAARPGSKTARMLAENKDLRWNRSHIQSEMLQGILQGESIGQISKRLQRVTDMNESAARRNARTLTTGAENAGRVNAYHRAEDMGIEMMQEWQATLDSRTRHTHALMHGERVPVGEEFSNGCKYPGDPSGEPAEIYNCRCTLIAQIKGFETDRVETSPKLEGQSFDDWLKEHEAAAGQTQEERWEANEARIAAKQDFTNGSESGIMKSMEREREYGVKYGEEALNADIVYIKSDEYASKFEDITDNEAVNAQLCELSQKAIEDNNGTTYESMYLINGNNGNILASIDRKEDKREGYIEYTDDFKAALREARRDNIPVIALHNHGEGMPPSADDFMKAYDNGYFKGVVAGHNGQVHSYGNDNVVLTREQCDDIHRMVNLFYSQGFDADRAHKSVYSEWGLKYKLLKGGHDE